MRNLVFGMTLAGDYFEALGVEPKFSLDLATLQKNFYERSRQWHPDRFGARPASEQQRALDQTALLNDAYRVLRDPVQRAEYMLERHGLEHSKSAPPELLEEIFELNMLLEETPGRDELEQARERFTGMQDEVDRQLQTEFDRYDASGDQSILKAVRALLDRRRYIQNLLRDVGKALETA